MENVMSAYELASIAGTEQAIKAGATAILQCLEAPAAGANKLEKIGYAASLIKCWAALPVVEANSPAHTSDRGPAGDDAQQKRVDITAEYRAGMEDAKRQLIAWRDDKKLSAAQMAAELGRVIDVPDGERRHGLTDAFAAYMWGMMHLGEPVLELWEPLEDLQAESFQLEEA
jgi:hypothetical protein